jgi:hypothetical protein
MSLKILALAWAARTRTVSQKAVLVRLADRAGDDGVAWPSQVSIAEDCCLSERGVRDAIAELAASGHMTIDRSHGRTAAGHPRHGYRIHPISTPATASGVTPAIPAAVEPDTGNGFRCDTGNPLHDTGKFCIRHRQSLPPNRNESSENHHRTVIEPRVSAKDDAPRAKSDRKPGGGLGEVKAYFLDHGGKAHDAEDFWDWYEGNGWTQGKARTPLRKWQAAANRWIRNANERTKPNGHRRPTAADDRNGYVGTAGITDWGDDVPFEAAPPAPNSHDASPVGGVEAGEPWA